MLKNNWYYYNPSVFPALWLATQIRDSIYYSPPLRWIIVKYSPPGMVLEFVREFFVISQEKRNIWYWLFIGFNYSPHCRWKVIDLRSLANIHHYSPPLRWITVLTIKLLNERLSSLFRPLFRFVPESSRSMAGVLTWHLEINENSTLLVEVYKCLSPNDPRFFVRLRRKVYF